MIWILDPHDALEDSYAKPYITTTSTHMLL